ncbi:TPA: LOW QUALITY PROTEIN: hypothetical protein N0F65_012897 [Lagenidium giganteum]|uniref:DIS3-like exonuclease 1 n=1 Tax=Lagenidium giganteum TaxID=4803 RepID=A0AAV2YUQ8_9STRA|nr:TPA: LOW QUALITY PROTEIN: hypothetical protein N0F65_012897 [Lagenidium giganteum]
MVSTTAACLTIYHGCDTTTSVSASLSYFVVDVIAMFYADGLRNLHRLNRSRIMDYAHHFLGMFWGYIYFSHEATVCQPSLGNPYVWIQTNEVSTAFYNWFRMTNNTIAGALFVVTFFLSRIVFNTFYLIPRLINECQTFPYLWGCMPFFALQYLWFSMIINKMKNVRPAPQDMDSITQPLHPLVANHCGAPQIQKLEQTLSPGDQVNVVVRVRPKMPHEKLQPRALEITKSSSKTKPCVLKLLPTDESAEPVEFEFEKCYDDVTPQRLLFQREISPAVASVFDGINTTVFAYGATGTGKTFTMEGNKRNLGMIPRCIKRLFEVAAEKKLQFQVDMSYLEIYNDKVLDLLVTKAQRADLPIRQQPDGTIVVQGLSKKRVSTVAEFEELYEKGCASRKKGATDLNAESSRSHSILMVHARAKVDGGEVRYGKLHLIDLAGSEDNRRTGNSGARLTESGKINMSLFVLGKVITALNTGDVQRIPFRDSKLTRLLQDSLGGSSHAVMICNIAPTTGMYQESLQTLNYAQKARGIVNTVTATGSATATTASSRRLSVNGTKTSALETKRTSLEKKPIATAGRTSLEKKPIATAGRSSLEKKIVIPAAVTVPKRTSLERKPATAIAAAKQPTVTATTTTATTVTTAKRVSLEKKNVVAPKVSDTPQPLAKRLAERRQTIQPQALPRGTMSTATASRIPGPSRVAVTAISRMRTSEEGADAMEEKLNAWRREKAARASTDSTTSDSATIGAKRRASVSSPAATTTSSSCSTRLSTAGSSGVTGGALRVPVAKKARLSVAPNNVERSAPTKTSTCTAPSSTSSNGMNKPFSHAVRKGTPVFEKENDAGANANGNDETTVQKAKQLIGLAIDLEKKQRRVTALCVFKRALQILPEHNAKLAERIRHLEAECPPCLPTLPSQRLPTPEYIKAVLEMDLLDILNAGTKEQLLELHSIGDKRADKVLAERPFNEITDLRRVHGVTEKVLHKIIEQHTHAANGRAEEVKMATWDLAGEDARRQEQRQAEEDAARAKRTHWERVHTDAVFVEKSRRRKWGALRTQERYVRRDIACGVARCRACRTQGAVAPKDTRFMRHEHAEYVVPDAVSLIQCVELLDEPAFQDIVEHLLVLQTVWHEALRLAPSREGTRLKNLLRDDRLMNTACCVYMFPDQHHSSTCTEPAVLGPDAKDDAAVDAAAASPLTIEPCSDRVERAVVKTLDWYLRGHTSRSSRLLFLTHDPESSLAQRVRDVTGIETMTCEAFLQARAKRDREFLVEVAANTADVLRWWAEKSSEQGGSRGEFTPHVAPAQLSLMVAQRTAFQGKLDVSSHNPMEAFVVLSADSARAAGTDKVFVYGRDMANRGVHGDDRLDTLVDQRLKVVIDHWPIDSMYPNGHYVRVLGGVGSLATELSALLTENEIEEAPFSEAALACLPECDIDQYKIAECSTAKRPDVVPMLDWNVPADQVAVRRDLRETHRVFSVDPPGCQDIDDAMSVRLLPNGNVELGVHIADVTYFVPHASPLDYEARSRATTVYLVGQRLDMLPSVLSGDLCSLHENVDRLAVSVFWELDGQTLAILEDKTWFGRTIIRSCASMTYEQAHRLLQGLNADSGKPHHRKDVSDKPWPPGVAGGPIPQPLQQDVRKDLRILTEISRKLARTRGEHGGLDLSKQEELRFSLNVSELGEEDVEIIVKESLEIHGTIAELMILANSYVAKQIANVFPSNALLRRHPPPSGDRFTQLIKMAQAKDLVFDATSNTTLQSSLVAAEQSGKVDFKTMALLKSLAVRVMSEAEYVCSSDVCAPTDAQQEDVMPFAHYGLGLQYYTHFTSPIRRYADVIVHRQLLESLSNQATTQILRPHAQITPTAPSVGAQPSSLAPSVLDNEGGDFLDDLIGSMDSHLQVEQANSAPSAHQEDTSELLFPPSELVPLSYHLNKRNRQAKNAARDCDDLFLALYFSSHTMKLHAIITSLKQNGFLVYIPQYDLRAPVYIRDKDGHVQMDPLLCGVRIVETRPPTGAFASAECIRLIPQATVHFHAEQERLEVVSPGGKCVFSMLDEVEVQVSCDLTGSNARVPQLQVLLVGRVKKKSTTGGPPRHLLLMTNKAESSIPELQRIVQKTSRARAGSLNRKESTASPPMSTATEPHPSSLYDVILAAPTMAPLVKRKMVASRKTQKTKGKDKTELEVVRRGRGRMLFGGFEPPVRTFAQKLAHYMDERSEALEEELTIHRSVSSSAGGTDLRRAEREAMSRTAKLAAEKRHDKINRRNKAG